jgi:hypothetical protein
VGFWAKKPSNTETIQANRGAVVIFIALLGTTPCAALVSFIDGDL